MTEQRCIPEALEISINQSLLLAGFPKDESDAIARIFKSMGWTVVALTKLDEIEQVFAVNRFDAIIIDAEHVQFYAPHVVAEFRRNKGRSADAPIMAVSQTILEGFTSQLIQSGVDLVIPRSSNPNLYIANVTRAATMRLQGKGIKNA